jgi:hypothetical protein
MRIFQAELFFPLAETRVPSCGAMAMTRECQANPSDNNRRA